MRVFSCLEMISFEKELLGPFKSSMELYLPIAKSRQEHGIHSHDVKDTSVVIHHHLCVRLSFSLALCRDTGKQLVVQVSEMQTEQTSLTQSLRWGLSPAQFFLGILEIPELFFS